MDTSHPNRTLFLSGLGNECSLEILKQFIIAEYCDCIESAVYYKDRGTAYLNIDTQEKCESLIEFFQENEIFYNGTKCILIWSRTPMRMSGIYALRDKKEVSFWTRRPVGENLNELIKSAEKMDTEIQIIFRKISGLLSLKGNIMGSALLKKYYEQYHEELNFKKEFGYSRLLPFLRHGEGLHYFHLNHALSQDVQICLRKEDSCYEVLSSGRLKRNFGKMIERGEINTILPSPKKTIFRTPPWRVY